MRLHLSRVAAMSAAVLLLLVVPARAAEPPPFTAEQLDQMLAPIALFPDALLSQVLMAATYPSDVTLAVQWAFAHRQLEGDAAVEAVHGEPWDPSVQSLVAFPQVLAMLGEKPEWVQDLGDAFLGQPNEVMDSVQFLRAKAQAAGNLKSDERQTITVEPAPPPAQTVIVNAPPPPTQIITIVPANPQVVFVPIYNPVYVFGPWWHPTFPPFFFPPPPRWGFGWRVGPGIWWGVGIGVSYSLWGGVDWRRRDVTINVNTWNNININRRISSNDRNVNWRHDGRNRNGVPYRDSASRERWQNARGDRNAREEYRGREVQRRQARQALSDRVGAENLNRDALRNVDRSQLQNRAANVDRSQLQNRAANVDRSQLQNRAAGVDRSQAQNRAANAAIVNRDNALRGADNGGQARQQFDRGNASRQAMQQRPQPPARSGQGGRQSGNAGAGPGRGGQQEGNAGAGRGQGGRQSGNAGAGRGR